MDRSARVDGGLFVGLGQTWQAADAIAIAIAHALSQARRPMTSDNPQLEMNSTHIWTALAPDVQKKVHQAIAQAYESFRDGDSYKLKTHMRIAFARRP